MTHVSDPLTGRLHRLFARAEAARARTAELAEAIETAGALPARTQAAIGVRLLDEVDAAVIATDARGRVTHWNAAAERLYGWTAAEAIGAPAQSLLVPASADWDALEIMTAVLSEGSWEGRFDVRRKDGTVFPVHVRDVALTDDRGNPVAVVGVSREIRRGERRDGDELRVARDELRAMAGLLQEPIVVFERGCVAFASEPAERLLGYRSGELVGAAAARVVPMAEGLREAVDDAEGLALTREGASVAVTITATPIARAAGAQGVVVLLAPAPDGDRRPA